MTIPTDITHRLLSSKVDLGDPTLVGSDAWNDRHAGNGLAIYNVLDASAGVGQGNASTDSDAFEAAADAAAADKGMVHAPQGEYLLPWRENPNFPGYWSGLHLRSGCAFRGAGPGTVLKLPDGEADLNGSMIRNFELLAGDEDITLADFTLDGNGDNQTTLYHGVDMLRVRGAYHHRVKVINVRGTASGPPGETFGLTATLSTDVYYTDCQVHGTAGTQGSGFASNQCTNVNRINCLAHGMSAGMGFADWHSRGVKHANCAARLCGANGFNSEGNEDISYVNCDAGGRSSEGTDPYPFAADTELGNGGYGFAIHAGTKHALLANCRSSYNGGGFVGLESSSVQIEGGSFRDNAAEGIFFDTTSARLSHVARGVEVSGNGTTPWSIQLDPAESGVHVPGYFVGYPNVPALALPATADTLVFRNPYPFTVAIYMIGGAISYMQIDGAEPPVSARLYYLRPGGTITLWYTGSPTWQWWPI
jgi:hypothetical protein